LPWLLSQPNTFPASSEQKPCLLSFYFVSKARELYQYLVQKNRIRSNLLIDKAKDRWQHFQPAEKIDFVGR